MIRYDDIISLEKLKDVYENIYKNTCHKGKLVRFELAFSANMIHILDLLRYRKYKHSDYNIFLIKEPKYRIIMSEVMTDKIVNHLVSKYVLIPVLEPKLINTNVATRKDMGTKMGVFYFKKYINKIKLNYDKVYVLKCDISKYFYNIDHKILLNKLKKDIEDKELFDLIKEIVCSTDGGRTNMFIDKAIKKEKERVVKVNAMDVSRTLNDLDGIPRYECGKGLPIGNETSQILAIYYLSSLDHFIKEKLHIKYYVRYMDDFLLIHHDLNYLKSCLCKIEVEVNKLGLKLNKKTQIYDLNKGINFLGYKFILKGKKLIVLINNQSKKRIKKKLRLLKRKDMERYKVVRASYKGYFMGANANEFKYKIRF